MASSAPCKACLRVLRQHARTSSAELRLFRHISSTSLPPQRLLRASFILSRPSRRTFADATTPNEPTQSPTPISVRDSGSATAPLDNVDLTRASCTTLFKECARQADYSIPQAFIANAEIPKTTAGEDLGEGTGWWYEALRLTPTFNTWAQITFLHMYLLTVRMRYFSAEDAQRWQQQLHDAFFLEAEHRMNIFHGISSRAIRNRYLKELYNQWRGVLGAYDEGLIKGDAVLGTAVWRNIFKADENADWRDVALVVSFMRRGLRALDKAGDATIATALVRFGTPLTERAIVEEESRGLKAPFGLEDEQMLVKLKSEAKETDSK
ncbi:hypothetical protein FH972_023501 [Carpinus fangiana]|uniref:Ubiquinol-cytochrome c chaperone domain-containing protein n=1 Tax=Carpinus fangiana TaxID=176857 RepID=A0A5N6KVC6_9ROSI|nr:hypothetical protein FH972_023501 [Carpinus fangiana]